MSGLGLVLSIAKDALASQTYGIDVTAHNIANVSTPGYSRQSAVREAKEPAPYGGVLLGRGVDTTQVVRYYDQFIEGQLMQKKSSMSSSKELENYMQILEGMFNENSGTSISGMLADFWAQWHDIANNPSGAPERIALYEHSILLSGQLDSLNTDLTQLETDLTNAVSAGIEKINQITTEIAELNDQIAGMETGGIANDLRDQRNTLVSELGEYLDVKTFEQDNGSLTVITVKGGTLVSGNDSYELELGGDDGKRVQWKAAGTDITDYLTRGKLGGWLDMRDGVIAKYKMELDSVAKEFIWAVNEQHSEGVGLQLFSSAVTGTYKTYSSGMLSTLTYGDKIDYTKDFRMWITDGTTPTAVNVDMGISTGTVTWVDLDANTTYEIAVTTGGVVSSDDTEIKWRNRPTGGSWSNWTTGVPIAGATGNCTIDLKTVTFATDKLLVAGNTFTINTNSSGTPNALDLTPSGTANSVSDTYIFEVTTGGTIGSGTQEITWSNSVKTGTISITAAGNYTVDGMTLNFASGTLVADDTFTIATDTDGDPTANLPSAWHWTLDSFKDRFNTLATAAGDNITASVTSDYALTFSPDATYSYGFSDQKFDVSGVMAALGINTFFKGDSAGSIGTNPQIDNKDFIAAGKINNNVGLAVAATGNTSTGTITTSGPYTDTADATYTITIDVGGTTFSWSKSDLSTGGPTAFTNGSPVTMDDGVILTFNPGTYVAGETFTIAVTASSDSSRLLAKGNNTNALDIADLQYSSRNIDQWTCSRRSTANSSANSAATLEDHYHSMVGSIGIKSASITRNRAFNEVMANKLGLIRDSISAVSLDEEMTNLIKFQSAYAAAAKLISVSDEMLNTLLNVK